MTVSTQISGTAGSARVEALTPRRVRRLKASYTTRHVARWAAADPDGLGMLSGPDVVPRVGDVVVARVEKIGQHTRIETPNSRRALLFPGDEILVAFGHRYAPDQFEAEVPARLGPAHLVAAGGLAGDVLSQHQHVQDATRITTLGLLCRDGEVATLKTCAPLSVGTVPASTGRATRASVVAVVGTSMNSGKSTTAGALIRGLTAAGLDVAAGKATGTGAGGDSWLFGDSGAGTVFDFTDFGHPSTYKLPHDEVRALLAGLVEALVEARPDVIVLEIADGVFQQETSALLADPLFAGLVDSVVFAAADATGAFAGVQLLAGRGIEVAAVSGVVTASPLAMREAQAAVPVPVVRTEDLAQGALATKLLPVRRTGGHQEVTG